MVHSMVERATGRMLIGPDWAMNVEICDMLNCDPGQAKAVVKGIKKRIQSRNSKVQLLALTLLETIVKNCGDIVHMHVAEREIPRQMVKIAKKKPDFHVKEKILTLIDTWREIFGGPGARYHQYYAAYQELLRAGAVFSQRSERSAPVFTPTQTQPLPSYPANMRNSGNQDQAEASAESEYPTLSLTEIQNAQSIMDVLAEMINAIDPSNKESLKQDVIVDLVEQCRTYKQRVVHLVNSTMDESLLCQGLALNDELQKLLAKHEAMVSGGAAPVETLKADSNIDLLDVDAPLVDTGDSSNQSNERSTANDSSATPANADPKIDLLSGDLLSGDGFGSSASQDALALVPVSGAQPSSPVASSNNALALVDMFPTNGDLTPDTSNSQPAFSAGQTYPMNQDFLQKQNVQAPHAKGVATSMGLHQYEQPGFPQATGASWTTQGAQQQQPHSLSVYGAQNGALPPPPWESQSTESNQPFSSQYPPSVANQQSATFQGGAQNPFTPQPTGNEQMPGMYGQQIPNGHMPGMNAQPMQNSMPGMYPQAYAGGQMMSMMPQGMSNGQMGSMYPQQIYVNQMAGYGYDYGYPQQQPTHIQYVDQRMHGLSMRDDVSFKTASSDTSMASYLPPMKKQPKGDDKLFGDLVDVTKFQPGKSTPGRTGSA